MEPYFSDDRAGIHLFLGDCREILPTLGKFDACVTDIPFGTGTLAGGYGRAQLSGVNGHWERNIAGDESLETFEQSMPIIADKIDNGWILCFFGCKNADKFMAIATRHAEWFGEIIWNKRSPGLGFHIRYSHESIAVLKRGETVKPAKPIFSVLESSVIADVHPHEKPLDVCGKLINFCTVAGQTVLEPFAGSGTVMRACKDAGRRCTAIEIDERYAEIAARRMEQEALPMTAEQKPLVNAEMVLQ